MATVMITMAAQLIHVIPSMFSIQKCTIVGPGRYILDLA